MHQQQTVNELQFKIRLLEEELRIQGKELQTALDKIDELKELMCVKTVLVLPIEWGLSPTETKVLRIIMRREIVSRQEVYNFVYDVHSSNPPAERTVDAHICHIRRKFKRAGVPVVIETRFGLGFTTDKESRDYLMQFLKEETGQ